MRIGRYTYLNSLPFFWQEDLWPGELIPATPRAMGFLAQQEQLDAGPLATADLLRLKDRFEPLPYGIVAPQAAQSVLLFSHQPIDKLQGAIVGISEETSTSVRLLQVLLEVRYGVRPAGYFRGVEGEATLVIGDEALRRRRNPKALLMYDLGREWFRWTGLPFVFAQWAIRRSAPEWERRRLIRILEESIEGCFAQLPAVCTQCAPGWLNPKELENYLRGFSYRVGTIEEQAMARFQAYLLSLDRASRVSASQRGLHDDRAHS